jgi:uncharacterized protein (DUF488 family)
MVIYTIGFTQKSASEFFGSLKDAGIRRLLDIRLNNKSQLAGFTKKDDLAFFLREICGVEYKHEPMLAPTPEMLDAYKKNGGCWEDYEIQFLGLMRDRSIDSALDPNFFATPTVLLCSELTAEHCHRRLVAEYLQEKWGGLSISHL